MKRRTRIYYTSKRRLSGIDISKVIPWMISPECSTDFILLSYLLSTRLVGIVLLSESGIGWLFHLMKERKYPEA
ncbi:hypothetical protein PEC331060_43890 [Pectobacterium carotovorum subsp. carotovorum]|nr:hypothetical protein PEC331060_43890 [Pectobacterium carotovorum subsp. carotovorum]